MSNPFFDTTIEWMITSTETGNFPLVILVFSLGLNYHLWKKLGDSTKIHQKLSDLLKKIEPILGKILDEKSLTKSEKEDIKIIRNIINYGVIC